MKLLDKLFDIFIKNDEAHNQPCASGYMDSRNVFVMRDDNDNITSITTSFVVKAGRRSQAFIEVVFTEKEVKLNRIYGKTNISPTDAENIAIKYAEVVRMYDAQKVS